MRTVILLAALGATVASPALARAHTDDERDAARIARHLNDPRTQDALAGGLAAMTDALLDVRIDRLRAAMARIDPEMAPDDDARTLGDVVERDDPYVRERMEGESRAALRAMGSAATGIAGLAPELRRMSEDFERRIDRSARRIERAY